MDLFSFLLSNECSLLKGNFTRVNVPVPVWRFGQFGPRLVCDILPVVPTGNRHTSTSSCGVCLRFSIHQHREDSCCCCCRRCMQVLSIYRRISPASLALLFRRRFPEQVINAAAASSRISPPTWSLLPRSATTTKGNMSTSGSSESHTSSSMSSTRTESDAFGDIVVDDTRYWGAQTQRSLKNFPIGGRESRMPVEVIKGNVRTYC